MDVSLRILSNHGKLVWEPTKIYKIYVKSSSSSNQGYYIIGYNLIAIIFVRYLLKTFARDAFVRFCLRGSVVEEILLDQTHMKSHWLVKGATK